LKIQVAGYRLQVAELLKSRNQQPVACRLQSVPAVLIQKVNRRFIFLFILPFPI
jgi:hypothetical protein